MHIDAYRFGHITIDGTEYDEDLVLAPDGVHPHWRRPQGHEVTLFDIADLLEPKPSRIIIGTGAHGVCHVAGEVEAYCRSLGIELIAVPTPEAVVEFNALSDQSTTVAALHLTC